MRTRPTLGRTGPRGPLLLAFCLPLAALALAQASVAQPPSYVESSQGLIPPSLEAGRTELEFADVNADGLLDLVSIGDHGSPYVNTDEHGIMVWFGDGQGRWSVYQTGDFGYGGIALGDLNADGLLDAAYGMHHDYASGDFGDQLLEAALGDGTGRAWTPWDDGLATAGEDWGMFGTDMADIDNDGHLDIGSNSFGCCAGVHVYHNNADGTWTPVWGFVGGNSAMDFLFGDVNADGFADLVAAQASGTVYLGDGQGGFTLADGNLPAGGTSGRNGPSLGDIDNDGDLDIAYRGSGGSLQVWRWNTLGNWLNASAGLPTSGVSATQLADMDGDDFIDLVALIPPQIRVWKGDGGSSWTEVAAIPLSTPGYLSALRVGGDIDHNGRPDIAVICEEGSWPNEQNKFHVFREASVPGALGARLVRPRGGERFAGGSVQFIDWMTAVPSGTPAVVAVDLSTSGPGGPWTPIASGLPDNGRYQWNVPVVGPTSDAYLRLRVASGTDLVEVVQPRPFTILPPTAASVADAAMHPGGRLIAFPNPTLGVVHFDSGDRLSAGPLKIFDVRGVLVRVVSGGASDWDGRDARGLPAPPGVYFGQRAGCGARFIRLSR